MKNYREKSEFPRNKQMIIHLYELKLSIWKLALPQDENPLKTHIKKKTEKNILPEFRYKSGYQASPTTPATPTSTPHCPPQHFPSCVCFTQTMSLMQDYVIINMQVHSKSHAKTNTSLH